jgi:hypothetical protein
MAIQKDLEWSNKGCNLKQSFPFCVATLMMKMNEHTLPNDDR